MNIMRIAAILCMPAIVVPAQAQQATANRAPNPANWENARGESHVFKRGDVEILTFETEKDYDRLQELYLESKDKKVAPGQVATGHLMDGNSIFIYPNPENSSRYVVVWSTKLLSAPDHGLRSGWIMPLNLLPDYVSVKDGKVTSGGHFDTTGSDGHRALADAVSSYE